ncbi:MAG TPA: DUF1553 domain-containing protein [Planctomycetaceae bacterium]
MILVMPPRLLPVRFLPLLLMILSLAQSAISAEKPAVRVDFNRDIKPILSNTCFRCHGPDAKERKGGIDGLRLDLASGALADLGGYAAIVPGKPDDSELIKRVTTEDPAEMMPPKGAGKRLTAHEVQLLREWIAKGGKYAGHWSYVKPIRWELPAVKDDSWPRNEVDRFILARLEREGLKPMPEADRYALIRRLSLDLTGLPPTLDEVDAFVNDAGSQAYDTLVDRLLNKETYGEYWAQMWLDLSRYADSAGYADDPPRKIWNFRDYVIRALNANKPFDQFTIEQIAGDLLPEPTNEQLIATAFHRNTLTNNEGGTSDEEFRNVAVVDRVNTTMAVWMGTTIACAQCHDHKYDPLSQEEFFRLFAFFNNSEDADRTDESPLLSIYSDSQKQQRAGLEQQIAALQQKLKTVTPELTDAQAKWEAAFPSDLPWHGLKPASATSQQKAAVTLSEDGSVRVAGGAANDVYTIDLPLEATTLRALKLDALPDDALPGKGPGNANGNFILTRVSATVTPAKGTPLTGRFVRVELPGKGKLLSLAEVQVFQGAENIARRGEARQISTDYEGPANLAIDGNTNGDYFAAKSTTHTAAGDDPWWEVDLKSEQPLERIVVWNRTDGSVGDRLANFKILVLNDKRDPVWEQTVAAAPKPSAELSPDGRRAIVFGTALADFAQPEFGPENVIDNKAPKTKGWAVGGQTGQPHALTLITKTPVEIPAGSTLSVTIEHAANLPNHTLGRFGLAVTSDPRAAEWARTPAPVLEALRMAAPQRTPAQEQLVAQHYLMIAPALDTARKQLAESQKSLADIKPDTVPIMKDLPANKRRLTKIQHRGNFLDEGAEVTEGTPAAFPSLPADAPRNRLTLARWLVDENNPLTARVIANRYWEQLFGIGIVSSSEEFGSQGELPFHPELLDWLATELVRLRWDMKAFTKLLVTSAAYRQSSRVTPELQQRDPDNRLLARGPRIRLSAETVRDQALAASGLLSSKMFGPPVKPPQPTSGLTAAFGGSTDWQTSAGDDKYRRALYTTWRRSNPYPSMATFDAPNREVCTVRRVRTNTPLQALVTLNDPVYVEAAQALARRMVAAGGSSPQDRARYGFRLCLARPPHDDELVRLIGLYEKSLARFSQNEAEAKRLATEPLGASPQGMNVTELAAWTVVGNVLLNLDETLMKR